jgi:Right handed beta helix region
MGERTMKTQWIVVPLLLCAFVRAATHYVDQNATNASDNNPGTAALPWKTMTKSATASAGGDSVIVKSGTYNERITFPSGHSGSPGKNTVFKAEPRRTVFMQGFSTDGVNHLRIEGFDVTYNQGGWLGGGIWISSDTVEIVDNYLHDIPGPGIQMNWSGGPWDSIYIGDNHVYHCQYGITVSGADILVENNDVERLFQFDTTGDCDYSRFFGDNITFRHNKFHGTVFSEVGSAHLDCWQTFDNNGEHAANIVWDGNWCSECDEGLMAEASFHHNSHDFTFKNNIFAHSAAWGLCVSDGITGVNVFNNVFYDIKYFGAGFGGSYTSGAVVKNNIFSKCYDHAIIVNNGAAPVSEDYNIFNLSTCSPVASHDKYNVDPHFVDSANGDFHCAPASPAIDAGTVVPVATDFDGRARPVNGVYDMGAFEYSNASIRMAPAARSVSLSRRHLFPNPVAMALLRRAGNIAVFDCRGMRVGTEGIIGQAAYVVENTETGALQKVFVIK